MAYKGFIIKKDISGKWVVVKEGSSYVFEARTDTLKMAKSYVNTRMLLDY